MRTSKTKFKFVKSTLLISALFFLGSCDLDNTAKNIERKGNSILIPNLEREAPNVWHIQDELYCYMYWIGNFETKIDTVATFDPVTFNETLSIFHQTTREGIWYLKDCEHNVYAESHYNNDSLISINKLRAYNSSYDDMKKIGNFDKPKLVRKEIDYY